MIEFLIAFLPVLTAFLCLLQLGLLYSVRLVTEHAAGVAARAAAVIIGDDPKNYGDKKKNYDNKLKLQDSDKRYAAIRKSALLALAPYIIDGTIESFDVVFPPVNQPEAKNVAKKGSTLTFAPMNYQNISKVRVRVIVTANCKVGLGGPIACKYLEKILRQPFHPIPLVRPFPTLTMQAEAIFPYQGARYDYP